MPRNHSKIVLDLEFNPIRDPELREFARHEIIEIGAVKLNDSLETVSTFQRYIKPQYNDVEPQITSLTGITADTLKDCGDFRAVMDEFIAWIGEGPFTLYSWSGTDSRVIQDEIELKYPDELDYDIFFVHWVDLQQIYQRKMGFQKPMGLANALGTLKIYFAGTEHGALADAINTAEVMRSLCDHELMKKLKHSAVTFNENVSSGGFTMGNIPIKQKQRKN